MTASLSENKSPQISEWLNKLCNGKNLERYVPGCFQGSIPAFACRYRGKPEMIQVMTVGIEPCTYECKRQALPSEPPCLLCSSILDYPLLVTSFFIFAIFFYFSSRFLFWDHPVLSNECLENEHEYCRMLRTEINEAADVWVKFISNRCESSSIITCSHVPTLICTLL
jgi:hypothetical protein